MKSRCFDGLSASRLISSALNDSLSSSSIDDNDPKTPLVRVLRNWTVVSEPFDCAIYNSNSMRMTGSKRPRGDRELMPVCIDTGGVMGSVWDMPVEKRARVLELHDPFPSKGELAMMRSGKTVKLSGRSATEDDSLSETGENGAASTEFVVSTERVPSKLLHGDDALHTAVAKVLARMAVDVLEVPLEEAKMMDFNFRVASIKRCVGTNNAIFYKLYSSTGHCLFKKKRARMSNTENWCHGGNRPLLEVHEAGPDWPSKVILKCFSCNCREMFGKKKGARSYGVGQQVLPSSVTSRSHGVIMTVRELLNAIKPHLPK